MKKWKMTEKRMERRDEPLPESVQELLKLATFAVYEADKRKIPRDKIEVEQLFRIMKSRKPEEYQYHIGEV